ncbi:DUF4365 domain-containing protein [Pectobacterium aroidearum]|uniref:DUF4365 domain-containing protein n=1 Tax=Pectobacterium aroidearum TaxID=1201031 RepID=UPI0032EC78D4
MRKEPRMPLRPKNHIVGDVGQSTTALILKKWGWTADVIQSDYGEDISSDIFINNSRTALNFRCQVKSFYSKDGQVRKLKSGGYSVSLDVGLCLFWSECYYPIILAVYDNEADKVYWTHINDQVRTKILNVKSDTVSLFVNESDLQLTKNLLETSISQYYSKILMINSPALSCHVIPVIMPFNYSIPVCDFSFSHLDFDGIFFDFEVSDYEKLPSWLTAIKSLDGQYLNGWYVTCALESVDEFYNKLKRAFLNISFKLNENEWLSFIVSPVRLCESNSKLDSIWNKEITEWISFSKIDGDCFSDFDYAFKMPEGFLNQIASKAVSWGKNYSVEPVLDMAVQVYSPIPTTPVYRESLKKQRNQISGGFISWKCFKSDVEKLNYILNEIDLGFREVEINTNEDDLIYGIICNPIFSPEIGIYQNNHNWKTFERGQVESMLQDSGVINILPGEKEGCIIDDVIYGLFGIDDKNIPEQVMVEPFNYINGMPLDHSGRSILFRKIIEIDGELVDEYDNGFILNKLSMLLKDTGVDCFVNINGFNYTGRSILSIDISLTPMYCFSTDVFLMKYINYIYLIFNDYISFLNAKVKNEFSTMEILQFFGEIYFESKTV